jgi:hypothetical protein
MIVYTGQWPGLPAPSIPDYQYLEQVVAGTIHSLCKVTAFIPCEWAPVMQVAW